MATLSSFFEEDPDDPTKVYNPIVDAETKKRIKLAIYAYAYEFEDDTLIEDSDFDKMAFSIDLSVKTRRPDLDKFFETEFQPDTGQWIHFHPELGKIKWLYDRYYSKGN